jgi:hypothetical protein
MEITKQSLSLLLASVACSEAMATDLFNGESDASIDEVITHLGRAVVLLSRMKNDCKK